jgi:(p)ppGpp synthase/HD superfamily hydrolase
MEFEKEIENSIAINKAIALAQRGHEGQKRKYMDEPYFVHPNAVAELLKRLYVEDFDLIAAAYCHDLLEDTLISYKEIEMAIGTRGAEFVREVSKPKDANKKEWIENFAEKASIFAIILKLADRICNVRDFVRSGKSDYAVKYFHKADKIYERLKLEKSRCIVISLNKWIMAIENEWNVLKKEIG